MTDGIMRCAYCGRYRGHWSGSQRGPGVDHEPCCEPWPGIPQWREKVREWEERGKRRLQLFLWGLGIGCVLLPFTRTLGLTVIVSALLFALCTTEHEPDLTDDEQEAWLEDDRGAP